MQPPNNFTAKLVAYFYCKGVLLAESVNTMKYNN